MKKLNYFLLLCIPFILMGCPPEPYPDPVPGFDEIVVTIDEAAIQESGADYVISGTNADYSVEITLPDAVEDGAGKYPVYSGKITSLDSDKTEKLEVEETASFKLLSDGKEFKLVVKAKGETVYYEITLTGTTDIEVKPELETEKIECVDAEIDTVDTNLRFKASNDTWTVEITLPDVKEGKYLEYWGTITSASSETTELKVKDVAIYNSVNDTTFQLVATMKGNEKIYEIILKGKKATQSQMDKTDVLLSPDQQKDYWVEIGTELAQVLTSATLESVTPLVDLSEDLVEKYITYKWGEIGDKLGDEFDKFYSREFDSFFRMPRRIAEVVQGKRNATLEDLEILLTLSTFGYEFKFDEKRKTIIITKVDKPYVLATFSDPDGVVCELKLWGEGAEKECSYTYEAYHWEYIYDEYGYYEGSYRVEDGKRTIRVKLPETIKMHFKHGSKELVSYNFKWETNFKDYVNNSMKLKVMEFGIEETVAASTSSATAAFSMTCGNKKVLTTSVNLPKYALNEWEAGSNITDDNAEAWFEEVLDDYKSVLDSLGKGDVKVDLLGKVQLVGNVSDGAGLINAYMDWDDKYPYQSGYNWWEQPYRTLASQEAICDIYDQYVNLAICYNGGTTEQAKLLLQPYYEEGTDYTGGYWDGYWDEWGNYNEYWVEGTPIYYSYYTHEPVLYFPQEDITIAIMTYLSSLGEGNYSDVFQMIAKAANDIIALDKNNLIFPEGFEVEF